LYAKVRGVSPRYKPLSGAGHRTGISRRVQFLDSQSRSRYTDPDWPWEGNSLFHRRSYGIHPAWSVPIHQFGRLLYLNRL